MSDVPWNLEYFRPTAPPAVPVALPASENTEAGFTANWSAVELATRYRLDVARDAAFTDYVAGYRNRSVFDTSEVVQGLVPTTPYYYRVRSANPYADSASSNTIVAITDFIDPPLAVAATEISDEGFLAHWEAVAEAVSYELDVSADEEFGELLPIDAVLDVGNVLEYQVGGLAPETVHFYRVRSVKANGVRSIPSNVIELATLELFTAQGGDLVTYDGVYSRHHFLNSGTFEVLTGARAVRRLIVAGGAQGGGVNGSGVSCGGGGGGGVLDLDETERATALVPDEYPVVVGAGGSVPGALNVGDDGDSSSFDGDTAIGGGHGGSAGNNVGNGGSGGGAANSAGGPELGGIGTAGQGTDGGDSNAPSGGGSGGGGAAQAGGNGTALVGGKGGDGIASDVSGETELYGAGGGGAVPVDAFGPIAGTTPGAGGAGGGGAGRTTAGPGNPGTGIGSGGGGTHGNNAGGAGTKGKVVVKYRGRAADITAPPPDPAELRGPITFAGCTREQAVEGVDILVDCNSQNNTGVFPDYLEYQCIGGGVVRSARPSDGQLVFRFSEPIRKFVITRMVTPGAGTQDVPTLVACDDYTVTVDYNGPPAGGSRDGSVINRYAYSPRLAFYPTWHLEPPADLEVEEEMSIEYAPGFLCVAIFQTATNPSKFKDPMFLLLAD